MTKRIAYMVFSHCEWQAVYPTMDEAQEAAREFREQTGSGSVMRQNLSLAQLQEVKEEEIEDDEWELYQPVDEE